MSILTMDKERDSDRESDGVISRDDYNKIMDYCRDHYSQSWACIVLQSELEKGIYANLSNGSIQYRTHTQSRDWLPWVTDRTD